MTSRISMDMRSCRRTPPSMITRSLVTWTLCDRQRQTLVRVTRPRGPIRKRTNQSSNRWTSEYRDAPSTTRATVVKVTRRGRTTPRDTGVTEMTRTSPSRKRSRLPISFQRKEFATGMRGGAHSEAHDAPELDVSHLIRSHEKIRRHLFVLFVT